MTKTDSCYHIVPPAHATIQALYLPFVQKNGMESYHRRQERETNFYIFSKDSEHSFQVVWLDNIVLNDIQRL